MKNKKVFLFLISIIFIFSFCFLNEVNASSDISYKYFDKKYTDAVKLLNEYNEDYYVYLRRNLDNYYANFIKKSDCTNFRSYVSSIEISRSRLTITILSDTPICEVTYLYNDTTNSFEYLCTSNTFTSANIYHSLIDTNTIYFGSDFPVYSDNTFTDFFFQSGVLKTQIKAVKLAEVMKEILGILAVTVSVLVSLIALRKVLQVLSSVLHKA